MRRPVFWSIVTTLLAAGCQGSGQAPTAPMPVPTVAQPSTMQVPIPAPVTDVASQWLGRWNGPEGTFLLLSRAGDHYAVKIQSLDGAVTYPGIAAGDHLEFTRGENAESIRATSGKQTGMKWLLDKHDCLTIRMGEGFCRD